MIAQTLALAEPKKIEWWHAMGGNLGKKVDSIVASFNKSQDKYQIDAVYKGDYSTTMTTMISAYRAGVQPALVQVFEVGTATMLGAKGIIVPAYKIMQDNKIPFDKNMFLGAVASYYETADGKLLSMPFNSSTAVLFYNKDAFKKAGIDPNKPPKTWKEVETYSKKILDSKAAKTPIVFNWMSWTQLEQLAARHNEPYASNDDGYSGFDTKLLINSDLFVKHITNIKKWMDAGYSKYYGRMSEGTPSFVSGDTAMFIGSSSGYADIRGGAKFELGVAELPYYDDVVKTPSNTIIGGATIWALSGFDKETYQGIAEFFKYLASDAIQTDWSKTTGYLPVTTSAYNALDKEGFYTKNPGSDIAVKEVSSTQPTKYTRGIRLGFFPQIRNTNDQELEAVWSGQTSPKQALNQCVQKGNALLKKFARTANH